MAHLSNQYVSGLCCLPSGSPSYQQLPLQNVCVDANLYDLCAEVKIHQTYVNNLHPAPSLECIYIFPLDEDSAVFSFEAELDGVIVKGRIQEKLKARAEYVAALGSNRSAMLLEQSSDNIFQCKVGNLKYGSVCTITLTYLTLMEQEGRHNRLTLPMIIAPKYTPLNLGTTPPTFPFETAPHNTVHKGYHCHRCLCSPIVGAHHHCDECAIDLCHGCYLQHDMGHSIHPHMGQSRLPITPTLTTTESKMRDLIIKLNITMPSPILSIQSPSHPSETQIRQTNDPSNHATVFFHSVSACSLSKDFILLVEQQRCFEPRVLCELDVANRTAAVSLAFIPPPVDMLSASQIQCELVFLIDCSGSMHGSSIACVRECMQLLLRSLPVHCYFNIITFGSTWSSLFPSSQPYDDTSLSAASHHISGLGAHLGGTEIYQPLCHVLTSKALPTHPRQVFLLTDGQVSNVEQLVQLASKHAVSTRLFTLGIGDSVDRLLCKKLACAGRGKCEFMIAEDGGGSAMREKVVRQVARAMQPVLTDVLVDWRQLKEPMCEGNHEKQENPMCTQMPMPDSSNRNMGFLQCPSVAPAIFMSSRYMLHALNVSLPDIVWEQAKAGHKMDFKCEIVITARSNQALEKEHMHHSVMLTAEQITLARVIHTLAAKERIRELEEKLLPACSGEERKELEDEILHVATKYTLSSSRTSFVIVYNVGTTQEAAVENDIIQGLQSCSFGCKRAGTVRSSFIDRISRRSISTCALKEDISADSEALFGSAFMDMSRRSLNTGAWKEDISAGSEALFGSLSMCLLQTMGAPCGSSPWNDNANPPNTSGVKPSAYVSTSLASIQAGAGMSQPFASSHNTENGRNVDAFEELIMLQLANGSWQMTPALIDVALKLACSDSKFVLKLTMQSLQTITKEHAVDDVAVAVILALQLLESHFKHRHAEWEMVATKALFFLGEDCKVSANVQEKIKDSIVKLLCM